MKSKIFTILSIIILGIVIFYKWPINSKFNNEVVSYVEDYNKQVMNIAFIKSKLRGFGWKFDEESFIFKKKIKENTYIFDPKKSLEEQASTYYIPLTDRERKMFKEIQETYNNLSNLEKE